LVTLVAEAAESPELRSVLHELLERDRVETRFAERNQFESAELLGTRSSEAAVDVYIVPSGQDAARLYFRAPDGERYLVRDVALRSGFDALGRELIAQIVEASVVALLNSSAGITRAQFQAKLETEAKGSGKTKVVPPAFVPYAPPTTRPPIPTPKRTSVLLEGWGGARYAAEWLGTGLGVEHGPGIELGVGIRRKVFLRTRMSLERSFPVTITAGPIDVRVTTVRWRTMLDLGTPLGEHRALALSFGAGQDISQVDPVLSRDTNVAPAESSRTKPTVIRSEVRMETRAAEVQIALALTVDMPLVRLPYDLDSGSKARQLAEPWPVRPGAVLSLAWQPRLGQF
jgi:hypothetical protein